MLQKNKRSSDNFHMYTAQLNEQFTQSVFCSPTRTMDPSNIFREAQLN